MPNRELKQPGYTYEGTVVMSADSEMSVQVLAIAHRAVDWGGRTVWINWPSPVADLGFLEGGDFGNLSERSERALRGSGRTGEWNLSVCELSHTHNNNMK